MAAKRRRKKLSPLQQKYFGKGRKRRSAARSSAKRRRSGGRVVILNTNPKRRRARALSKRSRRTFRTNPRRSMRRRFRRNPIAVGSFLNNTIVPAAVGAGGAIAVDMAANQLAWYLPASLQTPTMRPLTNIALSLAVGWGVGQVAGQKIGNEAAAGGIVVALYNFISAQLAPGQGMFAGFAYSPNAYAGTMNRYMNGMGYLRRRPPQGIGVSALDVSSPNLNGAPSNKFRTARNGTTMGYLNPAKTLGRYVNNGR